MVTIFVVLTLIFRIRYFVLISIKVKRQNIREYKTDNWKTCPLESSNYFSFVKFGKSLIK